VTELGHLGKGHNTLAIRQICQFAWLRGIEKLFERKQILLARVGLEPTTSGWIPGDSNHECLLSEQRGAATSDLTPAFIARRSFMDLELAASA
jgi:hypothetical protein